MARFAGRLHSRRTVEGVAEGIDVAASRTTFDVDSVNNGVDDDALVKATSDTKREPIVLVGDLLAATVFSGIFRRDPPMSPDHLGGRWHLR